MPKEGTIFKNYDRKERVPFIVYADFECFIKPIQTCEPNPESNYTNNIKNTSQLAFVIILNASMIRYTNRKK